MGGSRALPYYTLVGSSKAALESLARHLAVELAPRGIRVNILVPGYGGNRLPGTRFPSAKSALLPQFVRPQSAGW